MVAGTASSLNPHLLITTVRFVQREATGVTSNSAVHTIVKATLWEPSASVVKATSFTATAKTASVSRFLTYLNSLNDADDDDDDNNTLATCVRARSSNTISHSSFSLASATVVEIM